jgi:hypothetical protein
VALNVSTTALSNIVAVDESPLLEGLIYVGTDDGLVQVSEDGGKNWRKIEQFPGVPQYTYVTDVFPSPRDVNILFVTLNNWQRGDYKPYRRARTAGAGHRLPATRRSSRCVVGRDHEGRSPFAGTEFGPSPWTAEPLGGQGRHADDPVRDLASSGASDLVVDVRPASTC